MSNRHLITRAAAGGTMNSFGDRFLAGNHVVALDHLQMKELWSEDLNCKITAVTADFIIVASDTMKPGQKVSEKYDIGKPGTAGENAGKRLNGLARAITESLGVEQQAADANGAKFNTQVEKNLWSMLEIDDATGFSRTAGRKFLGRGVALKTFSKANIARKGKHQGKEFVNNDFFKLAQTKDDICAKRAIIEAPPGASPLNNPAVPTKAVTPDAAPAPADDVDMLAGLE